MNASITIQGGKSLRLDLATHHSPLRMTSAFHTASSTFAAEDAFDQTSQLIRTRVHGYFGLFESNISATKYIESVVSSIFGTSKKVCTIRRESDHNEKVRYYVKL